MLEVASAALLQSLHVIVEECYQGAAERNTGHGGGRVKARDHADQIAGQDEETQRHQESCIAFAVRSDHLMTLVLDERLGAFNDVLQAAGMVGGEAAAHQSKKQIG